MKKRAILLILFLATILTTGLIIKQGGLPSFSSKIASYDQWHSILIGKWEYKSIYESPTERWVAKGTIQFTNDNTFILTFNEKMYGRGLGEFKKYSKNEEREYNGEVSGQWYVEDSILTLTTTLCDLETSKRPYYSDKYDPCTDYKEKHFGNYTNKKGDFSIERFTKADIKFNAHYLKSGANGATVFTKIN